MTHTSTQKRKWKKDIRNEFLIRPKLMDKFKLSPDLIKSIYEDRIPEAKEIDILDSLLKDDRTKHSQKLRPLLNEVVPYRDCVKVAAKLEISNTTLRNFLKGNTENLSYNAILKIEHYLNHLTGRKNQLDRSLSST